MQETYIEQGLYGVLVEHLHICLKHYRGDCFTPPRHDPRHLHMAIHAALRLAGIPMGELVMNRAADRIDPTLNLALVDALAAIEPSTFTGRYDDDHVKFALGEHGGIWPESIRDAA